MHRAIISGRSQLFCGLLLVVSGVPSFAEGDGKMIAVYGDAVAAQVPPPGWAFLWNSGEIGDSSRYVLLERNEQKKGYGLDASGAPRPGMPGGTHSWDVISIRDKDGAARYFIASYTLGRDSSGDVWINNGNLRNKAFPAGTAVMIYVNDELRHQTVVEQDRFARLFQKNLGQLKNGDSIRVAVGPAKSGRKGGGRLLYTIEEYPTGKAPGEAIAIISPSIDSAVPQRGPDGRILKAFSDKHQKQGETALARKPELVFLGDSITARWPQEVLDREFGDYRPIIMGVGGDWVQNVLWRVENGVWDQIHPKVVVLLIGTNNISGGFTPDEVAGGISNLVKAIQRKVPGGKILVQGILPRGPSIKEPPNDKVREINGKLASLVDNKNVFFLDVGAALVEPDGSISSEVMPDRLHVAAPGYERWITALRPVLKPLLEAEAR